MNAHSGTMSPVSVDGSEWSGINQYQKSEPPFSPTFSHRSNLATPPTSGVPSGLNGAALPNGAPPATAAAGGSSSQLSDAGNPSPPSSVAARSSDGTLADQRSRRHKQMEEILGQHYVTLRRFLHHPYRDERGGRPNKARDKLLRLSATQFHELSTDVYDELLRRQQAMPSPSRPPRPDVPDFLPPREDFHEKRNQARQKLASLQHQRFRDLATDVYCELERRFPQFPARESRRASPAPSARGRPSNGYGPVGYPPLPGARRSQSRGPPPRMGRGYPSGGPPGSPMGAYPPRKGSLAGGAPPAMNGVQSNTIVPNKSTMVEDDDDLAGTEDDYDARSDAFALDAVLQSRRGTTTTLGDGDRKLLADTQSQVSSLQEKVGKLEEMLKSKEEEISHHENDKQKMEKLEALVRSKDEEIVRYQEEQNQSQITESERQGWEDFKLDLESKISQAEHLNSSLQLELERVRMEQDAMETDLRHQIDEASRQGVAPDPELQSRFADLEVQHRGLQDELRAQQQVTEEVRREAAGFLMEMRALSEQSHTRWEQEEQLSGEVHRLEDEIQQWKSRYAKAKTQLRHLRAVSTIGISEIRPDASTIAKDNELLHDDGLIKDVHVTKFQISIDELLRIARFEDHRQVMQQIRAVVIAVRYILQDAEQTRDLDDAVSALLSKATRRVSATANNMITAAKNFSGSSGLSPVSLMDAAASHLSTAVIELIRVVKICPTPVDDLHDDEYEENPLVQMKSPDYFSVAPSQSRHSHNESVYSAMSPPSNHSRNGTATYVGLDNAPHGGAVNGKGAYAVQPEDHELQETKFYLEDQTDGLVQSIQALVGSIRAEEGLAAIRTHVSAISSVVINVSSSAQHVISKPDASPLLRERVGPLLHTLDDHRDRLMSLTAEGENSPDVEHLRGVTNKLPPIAFEIARDTKELVQRLDPVDYEDSEDDFR